MRALFLIFLSIFVLNCGGGGGGGGETDPTDTTGDDPSNPLTPTGPGQSRYPYPSIENDAESVGDVIAFDGTEFKITSKPLGKTYTFKPSSRPTNFYQFDAGLTSNGEAIFPIAASNRDVITVAAITGSQAPYRGALFGMDGTWANIPAVSTIRYTGLYQSRKIDGTQNPSYPMIVELNLNNLASSTAYDLVDGRHVLMTFNTREGVHLSGNISDDNHITNNATFGLFGTNARTLSGGYSNEHGVGVLLVTSQ